MLTTYTKNFLFFFLTELSGAHCYKCNNKERCLPGDLWCPNSHHEYEYNNYDRILIKNTFNLSKLIIGFLLLFYGKKINSDSVINVSGILKMLLFKHILSSLMHLCQLDYSEMKFKAESMNHQCKDHPHAPSPL